MSNFERSTLSVECWTFPTDSRNGPRRGVVFHEPFIRCPPFRVPAPPGHAKAWTPNGALRFMAPVRDFRIVEDLLNRRLVGAAVKRQTRL